MVCICIGERERGGEVRQAMRSQAKALLIPFPILPLFMMLLLLQGAAVFGFG